MEKVESSQRPLVASGLISVFKKIYAEFWGPRLEYVLRNAILALLEYPESTLQSILQFLIDDRFRTKVLGHVADPVIRSFWMGEYQGYNTRFRTEVISPIQNKVGQFLSNPMIRNIINQKESSIKLREIMDQGKILLLNLAKGKIGEDNASLLGAMMITKLQLAGMSRVNIPEEERKDFYLYVDEFQDFATESFADILAEARKYRLNLILAHQYLDQLNERVRSAVFGNVGTLITFRVGGFDARILAEEFYPAFKKEDFINLPQYQIYLKLMIDGVTSQGFSAVTLPPPGTRMNNRKRIIKESRTRYGRHVMTGQNLRIPFD